MKQIEGVDRGLNAIEDFDRGFNKHVLGSNSPKGVVIYVIFPIQTKCDIVFSSDITAHKIKSFQLTISSVNMYFNELAYHMDLFHKGGKNEIFFCVNANRAFSPRFGERSSKEFLF